MGSLLACKLTEKHLAQNAKGKFYLFYCIGGEIFMINIHFVSILGLVVKMRKLENRVLIAKVLV